ncbi:hypothetical protein K438DRAFT_1686506 [Mycena galopus ATCC 62051]|nr:hypothetical protein K438DRAFT_1686506 [Mycena galopus ATCC 62051]
MGSSERRTTLEQNPPPAKAIMDSIVYYSIVPAVFISSLLAYSLSRSLRPSGVENVVGPPSASWIFGHMRELLLPPQYGDYEFAWQKRYGPVYRLKGCLGQDRLMVSDPVALQYVLHSPMFFRGPVLERVIDLVFGSMSVFAATGGEHRRLRTALNVGFTASAVRGYQPIF